MNIVEYGKGNKEVIILLHGGGLSWWNYREAAELLQSKYHVILPILDGHANSSADFTSIAANAEEIIAYIDRYLTGSVLLMGGLSLGGQILVEVLSQRSNICQYAILESTLVLPMKFTQAMIRPAFGMSYGLIKQNWFARLQFKSLKIKEDLFDEYYRDTCKISKENMVSFLEANSSYDLKENLKNTEAKAAIFVGSKEQAIMKSSARQLHEVIKNSTLSILPGYSHGEFSINHASDYVSQIEKLIAK